MNAIVTLLRTEIGLDASTIGTSVIERTVRLRMKQLGMKKPEDYRALIESSRGELDELIESVVVTETWFFRDRDPFKAFSDVVLAQWLPQHPSGIMRVLSIPCSTGEEPYSLAMALLDARVPRKRFAIDAVDISTVALAAAQRAVYGKNSFRGKDLAFRDRHFHATKNGYELLPNVRECVQFRRANILGDDLPAGSLGYDFIFCRNLLIYFDRPTQALALARLHCALQPDGVIFVGAAELPLVTANSFTSANLPMAFACHKSTGEEKRPAANSAAANGATRSIVAQPSRLRVQAASRRVINPPPPGTGTVPELAAGTDCATTARPVSAPDSTAVPSNGVVHKPDLAHARSLADAGKLDEAASLCEAHVRANGPSAQAFYLIGLVHDARNSPECGNFYRKALYLEPDHYESLLQLSLLLEKSGDKAAASAFKRRAERAKQKS